jgi:hypothetical protein
MSINDDYYTIISNILGMTDKIKAVGSFKLHKDYNKVCDIDLNETVAFDNEIFKSYIVRLKASFINEKSKGTPIHLIKAYFNIPYPPLKNISNKIGYVDGTMKIHQNESILDDVNKLPDELRNDINMMISKYRETKDMNDYMNILSYINSKMYAFWSLDELMKGVKIYYEQELNINNILSNNMQPLYFYIEVVYKNFRVSNYIACTGTTSTANSSEKKSSYPYISAQSDEIMLASKLSYYRLLKKFKVFIKWLTYTYKIKDPYMKEKTMTLYNEIAELIETVSVKYTKYCNIKNKIDIINIKIRKYSNMKSQNTKRHAEKLVRYNNLITRYNNKYSKGITKLENNYKQQFLSYIQNNMYTDYLKRYFRIN